MRTRKTNTRTSQRNSRLQKDLEPDDKENKEESRVLYHQCQQISGKYYYVQIHTT